MNPKEFLNCFVWLYICIVCIAASCSITCLPSYNSLRNAWLSPAAPLSALQFCALHFSPKNGKSWPPTRQLESTQEQLKDHKTMISLFVEKKDSWWVLRDNFRAWETRWLLGSVLWAAWYGGWEDAAYGHHEGSVFSNLKNILERNITLI